MTRAISHAILDLYALMLKKLAIVSVWFALTPVLIIVLLASVTIRDSKVKAQNSLEGLKITEPSVNNNI